MHPSGSDVPATNTNSRSPIFPESGPEFNPVTVQCNILKGYCRFKLSASEQFLDIRQLEFDIGRATMVALAGMGGCLHLA